MRTQLPCRTNTCILEAKAVSANGCFNRLLCQSDMTVSWLLRPAAASTGSWRSICFACEHSFRAEQTPAYLKRRLFQSNGRVPLCDKFVGHSKTTHKILLGWLLQPARGWLLQLVICHPHSPINSCWLASEIYEMHKKTEIYNDGPPLLFSRHISIRINW